MHKQQKYSHPNRCEGRLSIFMMPDVMFTTMMVKDSPSENVSQTTSPAIEGFFCKLLWSWCIFTVKEEYPREIDTR